MKCRFKIAARWLLIAIINIQSARILAQSTLFTYQGQLNSGTNAANGSYDLTFGLYDSNTGSNQQGTTLTNLATSVTNGLFTVALDFGNQFPGASRWLAIAVRTNGSGSFTTLNPRQMIAPTPYAITAGNVASGGLTAGTYASAVTFNNATDSFSGVFYGNGAGLTNLNAMMNIPTGQTIWVDAVNGSVNGLRGRLDKPFALPSQAFAVAQPGDAILVFSGTYLENTNRILMPRNTAYICEGNVIVQYGGGISKQTSDLYTIYLTPQDNCLIRGLTTYSTTSGNFNAAFGFPTNAPGATNVQVYDCNFTHCDSDGIYSAAANYVQVKVMNCSADGYFDTVALISPANVASQWTFDGGTWDCSDTGASNPSSVRPFNIQDGTVTVKNLTIRARKPFPGNNGVMLGTGATIVLQNIQFDVSGTNYNDIYDNGSLAYSGCYTRSSLPLMMLSPGNAPIMSPPLTGGLNIPLDTNNAYGRWQTAYQADQTGNGSGGTLIFTNVNNQFSTTPVSVSLGPDNAPNPGINVVNGGFAINGSNGLNVTKIIYTRNSANTATITNTILISGGIITSWIP